MSEYTITRALVELKTLDKRIQKLTSQTRFVAMTYKGFRGDNEVDPAKYQSVRDIIAFRNKVKRAVIRSNAVITVEIAGETYTVQEAIDRKSSIQFEKQLLAQMKTQRARVLNELERHNTAVETKLDQLLSSQFGSKDSKANKDDLTSISESYRKSNLATLVDPICLDKEIERLEESIEQFEAEVDFGLSESNALTRIKIE